MKPPINPRRTLAAWVVAAIIAMVSSQLHAQCTSGCLARIAELERSIAADEATLRAMGSSGPQVIVGDGSGPGLADSYRQSIAAKRNAIQLYRQQHTRCGAAANGLGGVGINGGLGSGVPLPSTGNADQAARMVEVVGGLIGAFQQMQDQRERAQEAREERERQRRREEEAQKEEEEYRASIRAAVAQEEKRIRELQELARRRSGVRYGDGLWIYRPDASTSDDTGATGRPNGEIWARQDRFGPNGEQDVSWLLMDANPSPRQEVFPGRDRARSYSADPSQPIEDWLANLPPTGNSGGRGAPSTSDPSPQPVSTAQGSAQSQTSPANADSTHRGLDLQAARELFGEVATETMGQLLDQAAEGQGLNYREAVQQATHEAARQRVVTAAMEYARRQPVLPQGRSYDDLPLETRLQAESLSALWDYANQLLQRNPRGAVDAFEAYCNRGVGAGFRHFMDEEGDSNGR